LRGETKKTRSTQREVNKDRHKTQSAESEILSKRRERGGKQKGKQRQGKKKMKEDLGKMKMVLGEQFTKVLPISKNKFY
jgi:hypothetical protein